jgi:hypothetical protein
MRIASLGVLIVIFLIPLPASPCSVEGPLPSADTLVRQSDVIVRVRAESVAPKPVQMMAAGPGSIHVDALLGGTASNQRTAV